MANVSKLRDFTVVISLTNEKIHLNHISYTNDWSSGYWLIPFHQNGVLIRVQPVFFILSPSRFLVKISLVQHQMLELFVPLQI